MIWSPSHSNAADRQRRTIPLNTFIGEGFFPTFTDQGAATAVAGRADLSDFEAVYTWCGPTASDRFEDPPFQEECAAPWDMLNPNAATMDPAQVPEGEPTHTVGLLTACRALAVFAAIAESSVDIPDAKYSRMS